MPDLSELLTNRTALLAVLAVLVGLRFAPSLLQSVPSLERLKSLVASLFGGERKGGDPVSADAVIAGIDAELAAHIHGVAETDWSLVEHLRKTQEFYAAGLEKLPNAQSENGK